MDILSIQVCVFELWQLARESSPYYWCSILYPIDHSSPDDLRTVNLGFGLDVLIAVYYILLHCFFLF